MYQGTFEERRDWEYGAWDVCGLDREQAAHALVIMFYIMQGETRTLDSGQSMQSSPGDLGKGGEMEC